jgi:N-acetyl-gamma-glutamyl-phosphate reductase
MEVIVPLHASQLNVEGSRLPDLYTDYYRDEQLIRVVPSGGEAGFLSASALAGRDILQISVEGGERITLIARFDNLGKGASGAAIQNMNLALGVPEDTGLVI